MSLKIPYTYTIERLDMNNGHILIKYLPSQSDLAAVTFNVPIMFDEQGNQVPLEENINYFAPYREWAAQKFLIENADSLLNSSGTITP